MENEYLKAQAKEVIEMKMNGKSVFGQSISINKSSVVIDGNTVYETSPNIKVEILGNCDFIETASGDVNVGVAAKAIKTMSGDVTCGAVYGPVSTMSGDVECGDVAGQISTMSGDVHSSTKSPSVSEWKDYSQQSPRIDGRYQIFINGEQLAADWKSPFGFADPIEGVALIQELITHWAVLSADPVIEAQEQSHEH